MTTTTKTEAATIVEKMIADNAIELQFVESLLATHVAEMERRLATVREGLEKGLNVENHFIRESAHKIEEGIASRRALALNATSLKHVLKAAQPATEG